MPYANIKIKCECPEAENLDTSVLDAGSQWYCPSCGQWWQLFYNRALMENFWKKQDGCVNPYPLKSQEAYLNGNYDD